MEITTGSPIGKLGLRDATADALEANDIIRVGDILKHMNKERLTKLSGIGTSRENEILCALLSVGFETAAPPEPGG